MAKKNTSITSRGDTLGFTKDAGGILPLFFISIIFFCAGSLMCYQTFVQPYLQIVAAEEWVPVPARVISSRLKVHPDSDGDTYSIDIAYSYVFNDRKYKSNRYNFETGSDNISVKFKKDIIAHHPPGKEFVCYVNPQSPSEAVINRRSTGMMYFKLLFSMVFVLVGLGGSIGAVAWFCKRRNQLPVNLYGQTETPEKNPGRISRPLDVVRLKPHKSTVGEAVGIMAAALFWNGIVSVFVYIAILKWIQGETPIFLSLFLIPFVVIGSGLIYKTVGATMKLFNPRPSVTARPGHIRLGEAIRLDVTIGGNVRKISRLTMKLVLREEAEYTVGTDTKTDENVLFERHFHETRDPRRMGAFSDSIIIPGDLMHSFYGRYNRILWIVSVRGEISNWPDMEAEFEIPVSPKATDQVMS